MINITKTMLRTYADSYLIRLHDGFSSELKVHDTKEIRRTLKMVREEIVRREERLIKELEELEKCVPLRDNERSEENGN